MKKIFFAMLIFKSLLFSNGHYASINNLIHNKNQDAIISIGKDEQIIIWNLKNKNINNIIELNKGSLLTGDIMPEKNFLVCTTYKGLLYFISLSTNTLVDIKNPKLDLITKVYNLNNNFLLLVGKKGNINLYDYQNNTTTKKIKTKTFIESSFLDKDFLFFSTKDYKIYKLDLKIFQTTLVNENIHNDTINNIYVKDNFIFTSSWDNDLKCYDAVNNKIVFSKQLKKTELATSILSNKNYLVVSSSLGNLYIYSLRNYRLEKVIKVEESWIKTCILINNQIITGHKNGNLNIIDLDKMAVIKNFTNY